MKVFSVGLPRTGNQSLRRALEIIGYKSVGHDNNLQLLAGLEACVEVRYSIKMLEKAYPNSLYIFTDRPNREEWFRSCHNMYPKVLSDWNPFWQLTDWPAAYEERLNEIQELPKDRLLIFNVFLNNWHPLCEFLNKPIPDVPFPKVDIYK